MELSPKFINKNYRNKKLDKISAINQLISIIDNSDNLDARIESINTLSQIDAKSNDVFKLLENLLISDSHESIRFNSISAIEKLFLDNALEPMRWALKHEESLKCLLAISKILGKIDTPQSKSLLINKIKKIRNEKIIENLNLLFKKRDIERFSSFELSRIIEDYFIIADLEKRFGQINFKVKEGLIFELDLSDVSSHVFGWTILNKFPDFMEFLTSLEILDLKFNRLTMIPKTIGFLTSMIHLDLSYNKIKSIPHSIGLLTVLNKLNLRYNKLKSLPLSIGSLLK